MYILSPQCPGSATNPSQHLPHQSTNKSEPESPSSALIAQPMASWSCLSDGSRARAAHILRRGLHRAQSGSASFASATSLAMPLNRVGGHLAIVSQRSLVSAASYLALLRDQS